MANSDIDDGFFFEDTQETEKAVELSSQIEQTRTNLGDLIELMPVAILLHQEQSIVFANKTATDLLATNLEAIQGKHLLDFLNRDDKFEFLDDFSSVFSEGKVLDTPSVEIKNANDEIKIVRLIASQMPWEGHSVAQVMLQDITDLQMMKSDIEYRQELESLMREQMEFIEKNESYFRNLFEGSQDAVLVFGEKGLVDCNEAGLGLFAYEDKAPIMSATIDCFISGDIPSKEDTIGPELLERTCRRQDGTEFSGEILLSYFDTDEGQFVIVSARDISERIATQAELDRHREDLQRLVNEKTKELRRQNNEITTMLVQQMRAKELQDEFVSVISHEFRTPLAIIDGTAQRLQRSFDKGRDLKVEERVNTVRSSVTRLNGLIDDILLSATLETSSMELKYSEIDIGLFLEEVTQYHSEAAQNHRISLKTNQLPEKITADPGMMRHIFDNLLSNAVKYSPGADLVEVRASCGSGILDVSIRDHGVGIPEEDQKKIFTKYFRAKTAHGIKGTGIGLNLVKTLVDLHGGEVGFESIADEGTTFRFSIPIEPPEQAAAASE